MQDILDAEVEQDGLIFEKKLKTETITEDADYQGIRVYIIARIQLVSATH